MTRCLVNRDNHILNSPTRGTLLNDETRPYINGIVDEMMTVMLEKGGVGIAANQLGYNESIFIASFKDKTLIAINPVLEFKAKPYLHEEGCLSLGDESHRIERHMIVGIAYTNLDGERVEFLSTDKFFSAILLHELDHLSGKLINRKKSKDTVIKF